MYKKIYIKSIEDLPNIEGSFIFGFNKKDKMIQFGVSRELYDPDDNEETKVGLVEAYDWYLIESPISVPTEEEVKKVSSELEYQGFVHELTELKDKFLIFTKWGFEKGAKWAINETLKRNECVTK